MSPLDKVLDRLSKLKAAQESEAKIGNSAAAESFAAMINSMLLKHELSEIDIPLGAKEEPVIEVHADLVAAGIKQTRMRVGWQEILAAVVADAHLCKILVYPRSNRLTFVGTKAHATVAEYSYGVLAAAADRMSIEARGLWWKEECGGKHLESGNYRAAWLSGFVGRIAQRFAEVRRAEVRATGNASTALIRLDGALVKTQNYISEKYKKTAAPVSLGTGNRSGRDAGRAAADKIQLGQKGITGTAGQKALR